MNFPSFAGEARLRINGLPFQTPTGKCLPFHKTVTEVNESSTTTVEYIKGF